MRKSLLMSFTALFCVVAASAQEKAGASDKMYRDTFSGNVPVNSEMKAIKLILEHCHFCDMGKFVLYEGKTGAAEDKTVETKGEWTVLKGDAIDENATVVEIDGKKDTLYFLRLKSGDLQKLDAKLREIKPAAKYMLRKQ